MALLAIWEKTMAAGMATTWLLPTEQPSPVSLSSFNPSIVEEQQQQQQQPDLPAPIFDYVARLTAKHKTSYERGREGG